MKQLDFLVQVWGDEGYGVYAIAPLSADERDRDRMLCLLEFFARVNNFVRRGCFLLDMDNGRIMYKYYVECSGGAVPTDEMIELSFFTPGQMFELYSPGITEIIFGEIRARDAFEKCCRKIEGDAGKR